LYIKKILQVFRFELAILNTVVGIYNPYTIDSAAQYVFNTRGRYNTGGN